jgi:hypothetical protein
MGNWVMFVGVGRWAVEILCDEAGEPETWPEDYAWGSGVELDGWVDKIAGCIACMHSGFRTSGFLRARQDAYQMVAAILGLAIKHLPDHGEDLRHSPEMWVVPSTDNGGLPIAYFGFKEDNNGNTIRMRVDLYGAKD